MVGRKVSILGAVVATLASSIAGASALRSPGAAALELPDGVAVVTQTAQDTLRLAEPATDLVERAVEGTGETVLLVVAGSAPSSAAADDRLATLNAYFGELQGFYIDAAEYYEVTGAYVEAGPDALEVPCGLECPEGMTTAFELQPVALEFVPKAELASIDLPLRLGELLGDRLEFAPDDSLLVTAFRTKRGAEEFIELARAAGLTGLVTVQAAKAGGEDVGLGQEPHPDGSGPLLGPLADQEQYQR